jgi:uncharacterized protein YggE
MKATSVLGQTLILAAGIIGAVVIVHLLGLSIPLRVINTTQTSELSVVGEGKVDVVPDKATVDVGVSVENSPTAEEAQNKLNTANNAIIAALAGLGVDKKDIKTSNYSTYPNYDYNGNRTILGYSGEVRLTITTKDTANVTNIVQAATKAGANNIYGTNFNVGDPAKYREEARSKAIANAKEQAAKIAKDLDIKLGKVVNIVESSSGGGEFPMYDMARAQAGGGGATFEPGSQTISSTVTLYFEKR